MDFPFPKKQWGKQDWDQIKNLTKVDLISLLDKDDHWEFVQAKGARYTYFNTEYAPPYNYLTIHYHPRERYREAKLLCQILDHWCCTRDDLIRWKVIKR